jgi:hypothetical protein
LDINGWPKENCEPWKLWSDLAFTFRGTLEMIFRITLKSAVHFRITLELI